ncbi:hypothetical protein SELMODRAFT_415113 [Selaginella moellendorffii]|uniref:Uncharacterized protein n=1 Tax=Selaginella moellendorffii TaxID=88036 RepID=D8RV25_SELML|nr:hypothetical protein SELMODRAFT_415113 [Selaginella moellendorffii]
MAHWPQAIYAEEVVSTLPPLVNICRVACEWQNALLPELEKKNQILQDISDNCLGSNLERHLKFQDCICARRLCKVLHYLETLMPHKLLAQIVSTAFVTAVENSWVVTP